MTASRYIDWEPIGAGGFGETFRATDSETGVAVVIKRLNLKRADDWKTIELFEREAATLARLDHHAIPSYLDYFEQTGETVRLHLVQQLAGGDTLAERVASGWRAKPEDVLRKLLEILVYLQDQVPPVIHRDIKPENVLVDGEGKIYLVDFGAVAHAVSDSIGGSTFVGTVGYMAPEQQTGQVKRNTDLYGAALTVLYAATGMTPDQFPRKRLKLDLSEADLSTNIESVLNGMLEPAHEDRIPDARSALALLGRKPMAIEKRPIDRGRIETIEKRLRAITIMEKGAFGIASTLLLTYLFFPSFGASGWLFFLATLVAVGWLGGIPQRRNSDPNVRCGVFRAYTYRRYRSFDRSISCSWPSVPALRSRIC